MSGDILRRIDETIDTARPATCGCGCDKPLDPDGPSLYYATPDCQERAQRTLNRPARRFDPIDLDAVINGNMRFARQLLDAVNEQAGHERAEQARLRKLYRSAFLNPARSGRGHTALNLPDLLPVTSLIYRRHCRFCHTLTRTVTFFDDAAPDTAAADPDSARRPTAQHCVQCGTPHAVPVAAAWRYLADLDKYSFTVVAGRTRVSDVIARQLLEAADDVTAAVDQIWTRLTSEVLIAAGVTASPSPHSSYDLDLYLSRLTGTD